MCSGDIVFFCCLLQISLASDDNKCINSVQQFSISSLESLAILIFGTNSLIILFRAALGMFNSSSSFPPSAIVQGTSWNRKETALKTIARFFLFCFKEMRESVGENARFQIWSAGASAVCRFIVDHRVTVR